MILKRLCETVLQNPPEVDSMTIGITDEMIPEGVFAGVP